MTQKGTMTDLLTNHGLTNTLLYSLQESRKLRILISWVLVQWAFKNVKNVYQQYFFTFLSCHYGFTNNFDILNFLFPNIIPGRVPTC